MAILVLFTLETETAMHGKEHVEEKKYSEVWKHNTTIFLFFSF